MILFRKKFIFLLSFRECCVQLTFSIGVLQDKPQSSWEITMLAKKSRAICLTAMGGAIASCFMLNSLFTNAVGRTISSQESRRLFGGDTTVSGRDCASVIGCTNSYGACSLFDRDPDCDSFVDRQPLENVNTTGCNENATVEVQCTEGSNIDCARFVYCSLDPATMRWRCNPGDPTGANVRAPSSCSTSYSVP